MKIKLIQIVCVLAFFSCKREEIKPADVISELTISNRQPYADGTTSVDITASLNNRADGDKTSIIFTTSKGKFAVAEDTVITQKASFQNNKLVALVRLRLPASAGKIFISARPAAESPYFSFRLKDSINVISSAPDKLVITPSAFSVSTAFIGELQLTAALSFKNRNVTTGNKVLFEDYYAGGAPVGGRYRAVNDVSDATSTTSAYYSPGMVSVGSNFYIKCTALNAAGQRTSVKDSCLITVIP